MRTYSHALLTLAAARQLKPDDRSFDAWLTAGAVAPDIPAGIGIAWLWARRRLYSRRDFLEEVCGRSIFRGPDAALHSVLSATVSLVLYAALGARRYDRQRSAFAFLLGWAGHTVTDALTHGSDARPLFWPVSNWRFESPVSYRERERYGRVFALAEHAALLIVTARMLRSGLRG